MRKLVVASDYSMLELIGGHSKLTVNAQGGFTFTTGSSSTTTSFSFVGMRVRHYTHTHTPISPCLFIFMLAFKSALKTHTSSDMLTLYSSLDIVDMASSSDMLEENVPAETTTVQVKWCGNDYDVVVQSDADVGELKRRVEQDMELPSKRQRHMCTHTNDELDDDYHVSLLTSPPVTDLIG